MSNLRSSSVIIAVTMQRLIEDYIGKNVPWGMKVTVTPESPAPPWKTDIGHKRFGAAMEAVRRGYDAEPLVTGCGGSIPMIPFIQEVFPEMTILLTGIEDPYTRAHSENESQDLGDYRKAIRSQAIFFASL